MPGQETLYVTAGDIQSLSDYNEYASVDPTGVTIYFGTSTSTEVAPTNWTAGEWGTWSSTTKLVTATSPTLGASTASIVLTAGSTVVLWRKYTVSGETIIGPIGTVIAK